jgi:phenylalanyl-tRNA synthetase beta chain
MKVPVKWLKDYIEIVVSPHDLANRLTMAGNEVKAVEITGAHWENIEVGRIVAINPHPNADRLRLATVHTTKGEQTVVCGAPNIQVGQNIAFASIGAELKDGHTGETIKLKAARIRGVESAGMICSEMELGISKNHEGILVLPSDAPLGEALAEYLGDAIIDMDVTPNRPDCLSVIGIAREAAALTGKPIRIPELRYAESDIQIEHQIAVDIRAADLCPRYCASLITGIKVVPSPKWMQDRLIASDMRPINNIVDITNYVMLEYGQPLHAFDHDKIHGKKIIVRKANDGENIISLDGVERKLNSKMLVIADEDRAIAVAGVMGGANTEVSEQTNNILLEAANFKPTSIHDTGDSLGLSSESRYRFERSVAPGLAIPALRRASQLIAELSGGRIASGLIDSYPGEIPTKAIVLSCEKLKNLLGVEYSIEQITSTLESLGFNCRKSATPRELLVTAPYWRSDVKIEADLIEEVARIKGYEEIPSTLLAEPLPPFNPDPIFNLKHELRMGLIGEGFSEILNFSLIGLDTLKKLSPELKPPEPLPIKIANPMTADAEYLRTNLRATLFTSFAANRRFEDGSVRLFEIGKIYLPGNKDLPDERDTLCAVMGGLRFASSWQDQDKVMDFFDAKGIIEGLLSRKSLDLRFEKGQDESFHPNVRSDIFVGDQRIGVVGEVHPRVRFAFDIEEPVYLMEIDLKSLILFSDIHRMFHSIPKFPSILRDMALIVDANITHEKVKKIIQSFPLVEEVEIFDVYSGEQVPMGKKSLAYRIRYRSLDHTLTDIEVGGVQEQVLKRLSGEVGAVLRSEFYNGRRIQST